jgi:tRNA1(Val) A37 N6-methylase TrmN6
MIESRGPQASVQDETVSLDRALGGRISLLQPRKGYRAGLDAALLAAACDADPGDRVLEPGCGVGAALLAAAARRPAASFLGLERDPQALELARRNVEANGLTGRVGAIAGDVAAGFSALRRKAFDAVLCNPPFFDDPATLRAPLPERAGAHMADDGLETWMRFLLKAAREGGRIIVIHRADRLGDLLRLLEPKAGSIRIRPVHPFADQPAKRVLVRAVKIGKAPLVLLPPLALHDRSGAKHTPEAEAILRGEADLAWT